MLISASPKQTGCQHCKCLRARAFGCRFVGVLGVLCAVEGSASQQRSLFARRLPLIEVKQDKRKRRPNTLASISSLLAPPFFSSFGCCVCASFLAQLLPVLLLLCPSSSSFSSVPLCSLPSAGFPFPCRHNTFRADVLASTSRHTPVPASTLGWCLHFCSFPLTAAFQHLRSFSFRACLLFLSVSLSLCGCCVLERRGRRSGTPPHLPSLSTWVLA